LTRTDWLTVLWLGCGVLILFGVTCYATLWVGDHAPDGWLALAFVPPVAIPMLGNMLLGWFTRR